jgi:hypothetical protein
VCRKLYLFWNLPIREAAKTMWLVVTLHSLKEGGGGGRQYPDKLTSHLDSIGPAPHNFVGVISPTNVY